MNNEKQLALTIAEALDAHKATDILLLDVSHLTVIADYFVIASGRSALQVQGLVRNVTDKMDELGHAPRRREGVNEGRWAVLDYGSVIVHIFHEQEREYYHLERLWMDGSNRLPFPNPESAQ